MKLLVKIPSWIKILPSIIVLFLLLIFNKPVPVASGKGTYSNSDAQLLKLYTSNRDNNPVAAVMYLWAWVERDPPEYVNNTNGVRDSTTTELRNLFDYIYTPFRQMRKVNADIKSCGCYPCIENRCEAGLDGKGYVAASSMGGSPLVLPDAVIVCVEKYYQGDCRFLPVGAYNTPSQIDLPNDSISSVKVGSNVKLTLYAHEDFKGQLIPFWADDPDLSDDPIDQQYRWDNNVTSLIVTRR